METEKITILFVDDDKAQLSRMMNYFAQKEPNFRLLTAFNGRIACKIAAFERPDVIVLDWNMPEMNGLEALKTLKISPKTAHITVIMASVLTHPDDISLAFEHGAEDYLKKPFSEAELLLRVKKLVLQKKEVELLKSQI